MAASVQKKYVVDKQLFRKHFTQYKGSVNLAKILSFMRH